MLKIYSQAAVPPPVPNMSNFRLLQFMADETASCSRTIPSSGIFISRNILAAFAHVPTRLTSLPEISTQHHRAQKTGAALSPGLQIWNIHRVPGWQSGSGKNIQLSPFTVRPKKTDFNSPRPSNRSAPKITGLSAAIEKNYRTSAFTP